MTVKYPGNMPHEKILALSIAILLLLSVGAALLPGLSADATFQYDEFYSLERSNGFDKHGDWLTVYSGNKPSFKKPPLQYWLNAVNLELGMPITLAIRLWSYIFMLGLLAASALTCYYFCRENAWTIPAGIVFLCGSAVTLQSGSSGLLDAGMSFFVMASLLSFLYAKENPKGWIFCGLFIGLGALQKAPVALLFVGILLAFLSMRGDPVYRWSTLRRDKYFKAGSYLALALALSWSIIQILKYGSSYIKITAFEQLLRFSPVELTSKEDKTISDHFMWLEWLWSDVHILAISGGVCVLSALCFKRWRDRHELFGICLVILITAITLSLATGRIFPRYLVILLPLLVCVNVKVLNDIFPWKPGVFILGIFFILFLPGGVAGHFNRVTKENAHKIAEVDKLISALDRHVRENDWVVIDTSVFPEGAYGYFGKDAKPYQTLKVLEYNVKHGIEKENRAYVGISDPSSRDMLSEIIGPITDLESVGPALIWRHNASGIHEVTPAAENPEEFIQ